MRWLTILLTIIVSGLAGATPVWAQTDDIWRAGARIQVTASGHQDVWAAGAVVSVRGTTRNDIRAVGAEVDVEASAGRDMYAVGAIVSAGGSAARDLYVVGARVNVDVRVAGDLKVAGARVLVGPLAQVRGRTDIVGAELVFAGSALGPVNLYGDTVQITGRITGDVRVRARNVIVAKGAVIDGSVVFETFNDPVVEEGATVRGRQTVTLPRAPEVGISDIFAALGAVVLFGVGAGLVFGLVLLIAARPFVERAVESMRAAPMRTLFTGLGFIVLVPLVAVLVMVTVVGIPIGLVMLLAFPFTVVCAAVLAAFGLSDWLMNRQRAPRSFGGRFGLLLIGMIVLTVLGLIPFVGFVIWLLALLLGLGALWRAVRSAPAAAPVTGV